MISIIFLIFTETKKKKNTNIFIMWMAQQHQQLFNDDNDVADDDS
jgi:hypothetical protein